MAGRKREHRKTPSAEELVKLYEASPTLIYVCERIGGDGLFAPVYLNPAVEAVLGWRLGDFIDDPDYWAHRIHPDDKEKALANLETLHRAGAVTHEYRVRHKDGHYVWLFDSAQIQPACDGNPERLIGYVFDLTRRKEIETAHREYQKRYRILIEGMSEAVAMRDARGYLLYANDQYCRLLGYAADELIGTALDKVTAPELRGRIPAIMAERAQNKWAKYESVLLHKDGTRIVVMNSPRAVFDDDGTFAGSFAVITDITESKHTQEELEEARQSQLAEIERRKLIEFRLREREERLRRIVDNLLDGLVVIDENGIILDFNPAAARMFGYEREEAIGEDVGILMPKDQSYLHDRAIARYLRTGTASIIGIGPREVTARRRGGITFPAEIAINEVLLDGQRRFVGSVRDMTERKRVEAALLASEASLANAQRMAQIGNWEWDIASGETRWSEGANRIFGFPAGRPAPAYDKLVAYFHPDDRERVDAIVRECLSKRKGAEYEHRIFRESGEMRHVQVRIEVVSDIDNEPVLMIGVVQDMTERKRQELALKESEKRFREFAESLPEIVFESDANGNVRFLNRCGMSELGYSLEDLMAGLPAASLVAPEQRGRAERRIAQIAEGVDIGPGEFSGWRKDDTGFPMIIHATPVYREGLFSGLRGMMVDISARKAAEEALVEAKQAAEWSDHAKTEFLANMSHELRTPLNAIIGFSEIIRSETMGPVGVSRYVEYASDINESGEHLLSLINDLLDLSKIEAGAAEVNDEDISVPDMLRSAFTLVRPRAEKGGIELHVDCPDDMPLLRADMRKIKQVLANILSNAVKFSHAGGRVSLLAWWREEVEMVFRVTDTGKGIAKEDIPKALAPFQQVGSQMTRTNEGTGLGLPLSKALVELHGGTLELQSEPEVGTTVTVRLPADRIVVPQKKRTRRKAG